MTCEDIRMQFPEYLAEALDPGRRAWLESHVAECAGCRQEMEEMATLWQSLGRVQEEVPSSALRARFGGMLQAYRAGALEKRPSAWWQLAVAASLLAIGVAAGQYRASSHANEISQLRGELENMRQMVTLSLLQQQSASERLRGVTWSYRMERPDSEVETALLYTVNHDANVNVRLAAVDALQKFAHNPAMSKALVDAIPVQDSPLVQIGLIDMLVQAREDAVAPALKRLVHDSEANAEVRQRAQWAIEQLRAPAKGDQL